MNDRGTQWLKTAEYLSLSASVVGTVASGVSQQALLATAPISLTLMLSLINRQRADRQIYQHADENIQQLHQDFLELNNLLATNVETLRDQLLTLPTPPEQIDFAPVEGVIEAVRTELESRLLELELMDFEPVREGITHLQTELAEFQDQLQLLTDAIVPAPETDPSSTNESETYPIADSMTSQPISPTLGGAADSQSYTLTEAEIRKLQERQNNLAEEVITVVRNEIQNSFPPNPASEDSAMQERLRQLHTAVTQLQGRLQDTPSSDLASLENQIEMMRQQMTQLTTFNPISLEQRLDSLQSALLDLSEEVKRPASSDDSALIFSAMRSLYERQNTMEQEFIATIRTEIQNSLGAIGEIAHSGTDAALRSEIAQLRSAIAQPGTHETLRSEIAELRSAIAQLQTQVQSSAPAPALPDFAPFQSQVNTSLAELRLAIAQLHQRVDSPPAPAPAPELESLQQQFNAGMAQLQSAIVRLETQIQPMPPVPVDLTPLQEQIDRLQQRLDQTPSPDLTSLEQRLDTLSATLTQQDTKPASEDSEFIFSAMRGLYERQNALEQEILNTVRNEIQTRLEPLTQLDNHQLESNLAQLQAEVIQLQHQLQNVSQIDAIALESGMTLLQAEVTQLQTELQTVSQMNAHVLETGITQLQTEVTQLKDQLQGVSQLDAVALVSGMSRLQGDMSQLQTQLQSVSQLDAVALASGMSRLQSDVTQLQTQLMSLPQVDPVALELSITQLQTEVTQLQTQVTRLPQVDPVALETGITQLQTEVAQLQSQLQSVSQINATALETGMTRLQNDMTQIQVQLRAIPQPPKVDLAPLQAQVDSITQQLNQLPPPFDPTPLEQRLDDLRSTIVRWQDEVENAPMKEDLRVFFSAMRGLYDRQG